MIAEVVGAGGFGGGNTGLRAMVPGRNFALCVPGVQTRSFASSGQIITDANRLVGLPPGDNLSTASKGKYRLTGESHTGGSCGFTVTTAVKIASTATAGTGSTTPKPLPPRAVGGGSSSGVQPILLPATEASVAKVMPGGRLVSFEEQGLGGIFGTIGNFAKKAAGAVVKTVIPGNLEDDLVDRLTGTKRGAANVPSTLTGTFFCPEGYRQTASGCERTGFGGFMERTIPGGRTGTSADIYGEAVMGRYGAALVPAEDMVLVRRCPPGSKLGRDNLCYDHIRKSDRKWRPGTKPLLTGGDMRTLRRAQSLEARLKRHGLVPPKKKKSRARKIV